MKPPTKRKQVKAWALMWRGKIEDVQVERIHAEQVAAFLTIKKPLIIPVTISYSTPKKNNPPK